MPWALSTAVFVIIWWVLLFAILPFGVRSQHEAEPWCREPIPARRSVTVSG